VNLDISKYVRLMLTNCSSGVWDREGHCFDPNDLPIPKALAVRIQSWQDAYDDWDTLHNSDTGNPPETRPGFPLDRFNEEGLALADALRRELYGWEIVYSHLQTDYRR
jgi:hypothetical protein